MNATPIVKGFRAAAVVSGLKKTSALDLALIVSDFPATAAGVFTTNQVKAAPVLVSQDHLLTGRARAIVANAGNANACTGAPGLAAARETAAQAAGRLGLDPQEVLVASTGVIGQPLAGERIAAALPQLVQALRPDGLPQAAQAIMTTDSFQKLSVFDGQLQGHAFRIVGIAKGAGMIMPDMATMLCFVLTDAHIAAPDLRVCLRRAVERSFNRITVDGDTSTNDTVLVLANGAAGNPSPTAADLEHFTAGLGEVTEDLARMIVADGEGATRLITIQVTGAAAAADAVRAGKTVANSMLVKTAFYGRDANWGRILAALGRAGITMDEHKVDLWIDDVQIVSGGLALGAAAEQAATERMGQKAFGLTIALNCGPYADRVWTCDLTHRYVDINANYRT